jgi:predicted transposase/invertase (TIGR01784 family)
MLTDALEIHFISMVKFRQLKEKDIENSPLHRWLAFLDKNTDETTVKKIIEMDTAIKKAQERIAFVSCDEETLRVYQRREMAMFDYASGMNYAARKGEAIGEQKTTLKHVLNLSSKNKSIEEISDLLDLPIEYIREILNK